MPPRSPARLATFAAFGISLGLGTGCHHEPAEPAPAGHAAITATAAATAAPPAAAPLSYRARGNEPFWSITLDAAELRWQTPDEASPVVWSTLTRAARADGFDIAATRNGATLALGATRGLCRDSMSGMPYPHHVRVLLDGREFHGCGGDAIALLAASGWTVTTIGGRAAGAQAPTLRFTMEGRANGFAGCNTWMSGIRLTGEGLAFDRAASTMMACPDAELAQERAFLDALTQVTRHDFDAGGQLLLKAGDTTVVTATPER